jgi:hypothetical protein
VLVRLLSAAVIVGAFALPSLDRPPAAPIPLHRDTRGDLDDVHLAAAVATAQEQAGDEQGIPPQWCGDELMSDDTANAAFPPGAPRVKVVYAYAADRPDRFTGWVHALQADVAIADRFLSAQGGGTKAIRFDMGTRCGAEYADIQVVPLPGPRANYVDSFSAIVAAIRSAVPDAGAPLDTVILADGMSGSTSEYGLAQTIMGSSGERPDAGNPHNRGGLNAVLFSRDGAAAPGVTRRGWWPEGFLHEITHTLGAVQWDAPHSTQPPGGTSPQYGHCWQGADVMCYVEDDGAAHAMRTDCAASSGAIATSYDCGRDDYFNPDPEPGSYLATHWNDYDSAFMAPCGRIAPACGGGELWVPAPPAATAAPTVKGTPRRGGVLGVDPGAWSNDPSFTFQWQRRVRNEWEDIPGATGPAYRTTSDDLGRRLRVEVQAANADGTASAATMPTGVVGIGAIGRAPATVKVRTPRHRGGRKSTPG